MDSRTYLAELMSEREKLSGHAARLVDQAVAVPAALCYANGYPWLRHVTLHGPLTMGPDGFSRSLSGGPVSMRLLLLLFCILWEIRHPGSRSPPGGNEMECHDVQ
ncbi:hypothetical protein MRX96_044972 [Rhipicephalus microplus]